MDPKTSEELCFSSKLRKTGKRRLWRTSALLSAWHRQGTHELLESGPEGKMGLSLCIVPGLCSAQGLLDQEAGLSQVSWFNLGLAQVGKFGLSEPQYPELCGPSE